MSRIASLLVMLSLFAGQSARSADIAITEVARVGVLEGDADYMFGRISFVSALGSGGVVVADYQLEQIRVYDADGRYVGDIGSAGEGPGEYERVRGMRLLPDGQLVTLSAPARVTFFDVATREYISDFDLTSHLFSSRMLAHDSEGFLYVRASGESGSQARSRPSNG